MMRMLLMLILLCSLTLLGCVVRCQCPERAAVLESPEVATDPPGCEPWSEGCTWPANDGCNTCSCEGGLCGCTLVYCGGAGQ